MFFINVQFQFQIEILCNQLLLFFETDLDFLDLTSQAALFGFINESNINVHILQTHMLLILSYMCSNQGKEGVLNLNSFIKNVIKFEKIERKFDSVYEEKTIYFENKWKSTELKITV